MSNIINSLDFKATINYLAVVALLAIIFVSIPSISNARPLYGYLFYSDLSIGINSSFLADESSGVDTIYTIANGVDVDIDENYSYFVGLDLRHINGQFIYKGYVTTENQNPQLSFATEESKVTYHLYDIAPMAGFGIGTGNRGRLYLGLGPILQINSLLNVETTDKLDGETTKLSSDRVKTQYKFGLGLGGHFKYNFSQLYMKFGMQGRIVDSFNYKLLTNSTKISEINEVNLNTSSIFFDFGLGFNY